MPDDWLVCVFTLPPPCHLAVPVPVQTPLVVEGTPTATLLSAIVRHTRHAVVVTDSAGKITWVNGAFEAISGYTLAEVEGRKPGAVLQGPDTDAEAVALLRTHISRGEPVAVDILNYRKDGGTYWLHLEIEPLFDHDGELVAFMAIETDITSTHEAQEALEAERARAEGAAAQADAASAAKSRFLATMSHDLRTPLNGILGAAQLLEAGGVAPDQAETLATLKSTAMGLLTKLGTLLDFAELEGIEMVLDRAAVDPRAIASWVVERCSSAAKERGLHLTLDLAPELPAVVQTDELRLRQLLMSLVLAGIHDTERGGVSLALRWDAAATLRVLVADTGRGDSSGAWRPLLERGGEPQTVQQRPDSLDAGLQVCRQIVSAMGGAIGADATRGVGTTVWVDMPIAGSGEVVSSATGPSADAPDASTTEESAPLTAVRVLLVDDNPVNRLVTSRQLEMLGCSVELAENGLAALRLLSTRRFQVVLMDCDMPVMDGWEATVRFRHFEEKRDRHRTPVIAVTASCMAAEVNRCFAVGMDAVVPKPVSMERLRHTLVRWTGSGA